LAFVRPFGVAAAVSAIDLLLGVQKEDHEGQIVVELEQVQVDILNARQAHAHKFVGAVFDAFQTDNLPVKCLAGNSRHAAEHNHERFSAFRSLRETVVKVGDPAVLRGDRITPAWRLSLHRLLGCQEETEGNKAKQSPVHEILDSCCTLHEHRQRSCQDTRIDPREQFPLADVAFHE
jgi:hypothetical protein